MKQAERDRSFFGDESIEIGDIEEKGEDDQLTHKFIFKVDPDFEEGDYTLVIKAFPDGDEETTCIDSFGANIVKTVKNSPHPHYPPPPAQLLITCSIDCQDFSQKSPENPPPTS